MENKELYHYGVLGMKWGKRKARQSEDYKKARAIKKKKISEMSNEELKTLNNRLNLEANYREVSKRNVSSGRKWVTGILVGAATVTASYYANKYAKQGVEALIKLGAKAITKK